MAKITTFLMFEGNAEKAMNFYMSIFVDSKIKAITYYGKNEAGEEGTVQHALFQLNGQEFMCIDSYVNHGFTFTPSMSLYVECNSEEEINRYFEQLLMNGEVLMPLAAYPFSKKFGWLKDQFGVTWQLSLK